MAFKNINIKVGASNGTQPAFGAVERGLQRLRGEMMRASRSNRSFMRGMTDNRRTIQQVGMQVSDFSVQVAGGQSAILAFTQNVPQVVQMFGAWGGAIAAVITVLGTLAFMLSRTGASFSEITDMLGLATEKVQFITNVFSKMGSLFLDTINALVNHFDVLIVTIGVAFVVSIVRADMASKGLMTSMIGLHGTTRMWAALSLGAAKATHIFANSLRFLRGAIISTGIGVLIVSAGYLIERMFALRDATESWGKTFSLTFGAAIEIIQRLPKFFAIATTSMTSSILKFIGSFKDTFEGFTDNVIGSTNLFVGAFIGAFAAIEIGAEQFGMKVANVGKRIGSAIIEGLESQINIAIDGINKLIEQINKIPNVTIDALGKVSFDKPIIEAADGIAETYERMSQAFKDGLNAEIIDSEKVKEQLGLIDQLGDFGHELASKWNNQLLKEMPAVQAMIEAFDSLNEKTFNIRDVLDKIGEGKPEDDEDGEGRGRGRGRSFREPNFRQRFAKYTPIVSGYKGQGDEWAEANKGLDRLMKTTDDLTQRIGQGFKDGIDDLIRSTEDWRALATGVLQDLGSTLISSVLDPLIEATSDWLQSVVGGAFKSMFSGSFGSGGGNVSSFEGGGFTGLGSRVGGVDGRGGKFAILHPNETVVDHTKGQSSGSGTNVTINVSGVTDVESFKNSQRQIVRDLRQALQGG